MFPRCGEGRCRHAEDRHAGGREHHRLGFGPLAGSEGRRFGISVTLAVSLPGMVRAQAQALVETAHQVCPYSNATRGNVDVTLTAV